MNKLYEALEVCLNEIEQGTDVDTALSRYPDFADELRPILETSIRAKEMSVPGPSEEVVKRNKAKLLQRAAEMREGQIISTRRVWSVPLRRALVTLVVVMMLFVSGTNLVRASSTTLPGDGLYPVKRTWEKLLLFFTFDMEEREALEFEHENERLEELHELFAEGRSANVDFAGYVMRLSDGEWRVSGITVFISPQTRLPDQEVLVGAAVRVRGKIQSGMSVIAEQVELLSPGYKVPELEDGEFELEEDDDETGTESVLEATVIPSTPIFDPEDESIEGIVTSIENKFIVVNAVLMDIRYADVKGIPIVDAFVKAEGYYDVNGIFIVSKIEFKSVGSDDGNSSINDNNNGNVNSNDEDSNDNDDNDNDNDNDNSNDTDDD